MGIAYYLIYSYYAVILLKRIFFLKLFNFMFFIGFYLSEITELHIKKIEPADKHDILFRGMRAILYHHLQDH